MLRGLLWSFAGIAVAIALVVTIGRGRFARLVDREARALLSTPPTGAPARSDVAALPAPVRRYAERSGAARHASVRTLRLRHGGTFFVAGAWHPIRGEQYFASDPPGFVWWGRVRTAPGVTVDARDRSVAGEGSMYVVAAGIFPVVDVRGPELDAAALVRLLGEMVWFPTALLDARYVSWAPVDDAHARATLRVGGREATATFEFGPDGLPARFTALRHRDVGGKAVLTPFTGRCADYREADGLLVPHRVDAEWEIEGRPAPYARFVVERIELDPDAPF
jgi:Family of unknown function (DUF6544)